MLEFCSSKKDSSYSINQIQTQVGCIVRRKITIICSKFTSALFLCVFFLFRHICATIDEEQLKLTNEHNPRFPLRRFYNQENNKMENKFATDIIQNISKVLKANQTTDKIL